MSDDRDGTASLEARWRTRFAFGIGLSLVLVLGALLLGWREHQVRRQQTTLQAELVIDGVERLVRERLTQLREELTEHAAFYRAGDVQGRDALQDADLRIPSLRALRFIDVAPAKDPPAVTELHLLPPEPAARTLQVAWDGVPGVRVEADLDPQWFAELLQGHPLDDGVILNLVHQSGHLYARSEDNARYLGTSLREGALFAPGHRGRRAGRYEEASLIGGTPKLFVYRRIAGTPLTAVVGTPRETVLAPAAAFLFVLLAVALLLAAVWTWLFRAFESARRDQAGLLQRVRDNESRLREAHALAAVGTWTWNPDTGEVHLSDEACALYGLSPAQAPKTADAVWPLIHPDDVGRLKAMAKAMRSGATEAPARAEFRVRRADGATRWCLARAEVVRRGGLRLVLGTQQDITAIAVVRERLRLAQEIARIGDLEWDIDSDRMHWSSTLYGIYGVAPADFSPSLDDFLALIHPDDRERVRSYARTLREDGKPCAAEYRIVRGDGAVRAISSRGQRDVSADGREIVRSVQQDVTELVQARDALAEAERQYRYLFEHNPVPMWVFDPQSLRFLAVNDATLLHYGYSREELLGRSILDIRPEMERARVEAEFADEAGARPQGRIWTHLRKDGSALRVAIFTQGIRFGGRPARLVAAQDVTEREASEQRFRLVARATSDAIYDFDIPDNRLWWSDSFYATFGYRAEEMAATLQAWEALVHHDDMARVGASLAAAMADPQVEEWEEEYRFLRRDGTYADVIDRGFFLRDAQGQATRMLGGMLDITEKRRHAADLRLLNRAVEAVDNGVAIVDARAADMPVVYVNRAFEHLTGYSATEVVGRNSRFLQGGDRDQLGLESIRDAIAGRHEVRTLLRNYRKDGSQFWNELHVAPVFDETGEVSHYVGVMNDVTHRHRYEQELAHRATHDQLTGLPNRELLQDRLQQAILNSDRYRRKTAVVFLDLDDFKLINDNLDHAAGDQALRVVAERLRAQVRETDTVGRFGGDEFVVVLTEQEGEDGVGQVISRISAALSQPMEIGGAQYVLTPSIGWCRYPDDGQDPETLLKHADMAMYQAKRGGRNRAVRYDAAFDAMASQRLHLVGELRRALDRREFVLAFQPIYNDQGRMRALECLVRWQHPERGLLPPMEFVPVCEESGLIMELGRRTLREAARHHALLAARGHGDLRLSVNVSPLQFGRALEDDVAAALDEFRLPPGTLELELTESTVMADPDRAIETMHRISALGVCLAIDDFGTGYSSLAYLKRLPLDRLKIDRSFVHDLPDDAESATLCASIIGLAQSLGLRTVGEGVETPGQLQWLRDHGCNELQGFLMARPMSFEALLAQLDRVSPAITA